MKSSWRKARAVKALEGASIENHAYVVIKAYKDGEGYFYEYVGINDNLSNYLIYNPNSSYEIDEVYNLGLDIESQLEEDRSYHIEKFVKKDRSSNINEIRNQTLSFDEKPVSLTEGDIMSLISSIDKSVYKEAIIYESPDQKSHICFIKNFDLDVESVAESLQNTGCKIKNYCNFREFSFERQAYEFAAAKHNGQYRKNDTETPEEYINHPIRVANLIKYYAVNDLSLRDLVCAALLHDTLEDTKTTFEELVEYFGFRIAYLVKELTNNDSMKHAYGKSEYLSYKLLELSNEALTIKLCDRLDNICSTVNTNIEFKNRYIHETIEILEFLQKNRSLNDTQKQIISDISKEMERIHVVTKKLVQD